MYLLWSVRILFCCVCCISHPSCGYSKAQTDTAVLSWILVGWTKHRLFSCFFLSVLIDLVCFVVRINCKIFSLITFFHVATCNIVLYVVMMLTAKITNYNYSSKTAFYGKSIAVELHALTKKDQGKTTAKPVYTIPFCSFWNRMRHHHEQVPTCRQEGVIRSKFGSIGWEKYVFASHFCALVRSINIVNCENRHDWQKPTFVFLLWHTQIRR